MKVGAFFPQTELGGDAGAVRAFGEGVEEYGYTHILAFDHVLGADLAVHNIRGGHRIGDTCHEPLVMFGYLAAVTELELVSAVLVLPQRQTALVAKQATEVDLLTRGRFRLGVGLGWDTAEYFALGKDFHNRGRRIEEQVALLRQLWCEPVVDFHGEWETARAVGIDPPPLQRPIPVWFGAMSDKAYPRVGRLADGWFPQMQPGPDLDHARRIVDEAAVEAGRDPSTLGMEGRVDCRGRTIAESADAIRRWEEAGATHVQVATVGAGLEGVASHLKVYAALAEAIGLSKG